MKNIAPITFDSSILNYFVNRHSLTEDEKIRILARINEYNSCLPKLEKIPDSTFSAINYPFKCFDSKPLEVSELKVKIRDNGGNICPYCNIDTSIELDHYLPRSCFPKFSLFSKNLGPSVDPLVIKI